MDSRAKQRLTGAVILVALFVLLVPELLTGPRSAQPVKPPEEEGLRSYTIDIDGARPTAQPMAPPEQPPAVALPEVTPAVESSARATPGEAAAPAATAPATAAAPVNPAPTTPAATPPPAAPPPERVASAPTPAATAPIPRGNFAVQLGSFRSKENADRLVRDMTAKGFNAFIAPITTDGRELYRVRVGPARDRTQAEALAAQLRRMGQTGSVVEIS